MSKSWSNDSISWKLTDRGGAPALNKQILWPSTDNKTFFAFGGEESFLDDPWLPPVPQLWQMTTDGNGGGTWAIFNADGSSEFVNMTRPTDALGGVVGNTGYIIGGVTNSHSSQATDYQQDNIMVPGIASFNITSGEWNNDTAPDYLMRKDGSYGTLHAIPTFGPAGLLMITGTSAVHGTFNTFDNITIYEPSSKSWYNQKATGDIPSGRDKPCTVGINGDNGTYEMYVLTFYHHKSSTKI